MPYMPHMSTISAVKNRSGKLVPVASSYTTKRGVPPPRPHTGERIYSDKELAVLQAFDRWKREEKKPHPTVCDIVEWMERLGWRNSSYD